METKEFSFGVAHDGSLVRTGDNMPLDKLREEGWTPLTFTYHGGGYRVVMERQKPAEPGSGGVVITKARNA